MLAQLDIDQIRSSMGADGMVPLGIVLDEDAIGGVRAALDRYIANVIPKLSSSIEKRVVRYERDGVTIRSLYNLQDVDPYFADFGQRADFTAFIEDICGWKPSVYAVESFNKRPGGSMVPIHQESAFFASDARERAHLWFAIDPADEQNGPVRFWLGSHRGGLIPHEPDEDGYLTFDQAIADARATSVHTSIVDVGGATLHNGLIAHDSLPNASGRPRLGLFVGYLRD